MFITSVRVDAPVTGFAADLPVVQALQRTPLELAQVTALTGDNGAGKSTLIEAIAIASGANPSGGSKHARFTAATPSAHSALHEALTLTRRRNPRDVYFLRGDTFHQLGEYHASMPRDPLAAIPTKSHGEGILHLARTRFSPGSLILLDEPEDGLSVLSQLELLGLITALSRHGAQVILATHSPVLLAAPETRILEVPTLEPLLFDASLPTTATREFVQDPHGTAAYLVEP